MSEQNKDKLSRKEWLNQDSGQGKETESGFPREKTEGDWEAIARRGRSFVDQESAEALMRDIDGAVDRQFGEAPKLEKQLNARGRFNWLSIAAGLLLVLAAAWWLWFNNDPNAQLYDRYFSHLDNQLTVNLMGDTEADELTVALRPYNARRYEDAAERIGHYLEQHDGPAALRLYYGISLMEEDAVEEAIDQFQQLIASTVNSNYTRAADWYLALAYLKSDQVASAQRVLQEIARIQHPYAAQAQALLEEL